jgi:hypothetical protein
MTPDQDRDLIERLRNTRRLDPGGTELLPEPICRQAASRLESLLAEVERLKSVNKAILAEREEAYRAFKLFNEENPGRLNRESYASRAFLQGTLIGLAKACAHVERRQPIDWGHFHEADARSALSPTDHPDDGGKG